MATEFEQVGRTEGRESRRNLFSRDKVRAIAEGLNAVAIGEPLVERSTRGNLFGLLAGSTAGGTLSQSETVVRGLAPGAVINRHLRIDGQAIVTDVAFQQSAGAEGPLVTIGPTAQVMMSRCRFEKRNKSQATFVLVEDGGRVIFDGGWFVGSPSTAGSPILNPLPNLVLNVKVIGVLNRTGNPLQRVTMIGVLE